MRTGRGLLVETIASRAAGRQMQTWDTNSGGTLIARALVDGTDGVIHWIGDSRSDSTFYRKLTSYCTSVTWGGYMQLLESIQVYAGWAHSFGTNSIGDARFASGWPGTYQDELSPAGRCGVFDLLGGNSSANQYIFAAFNINTRSIGTIPWDRGIAAGAPRRVRVPLKRLAESVTNIRSGQQNLGQTLIATSPTVAELGAEYTVFDSEMSFAENDSIGIKHLPASPIGNGAFAHLPAMVKFAPGMVVCPWSIGGRSVYGWLDNNLLSENHMENVLPLYNIDGGIEIFWIDLGANRGLNTTDDPVEFATQIHALIAKIRAYFPDGKFILSNQFPQSIDVGDPYYVTGGDMVAAADSSILYLDTYHAMPSYSESLTAGYMADGTHLNDSGEVYYSGIIGELIAAAAA